MPLSSVRRLTAPAWAVLLAGATAVSAHAQQGDPRVGLAAGWTNAGSAIKGLELVSHVEKSPTFTPTKPGDFAYANSDLAFKGTLVFQGSYNGVQVWDVADPAHPVLRTAITCPGGQGDVSVYRNLLFMSVEETRGRVDCGAQGVTDTVSAERFRGVRIFDIADLDHPKQVAAIQTCRGSHTHTLVEKPGVSDKLWVYVQGTGPVRPAAELAGCSSARPEKDPNSSLFRIEVIEVPLARPEQAKVVSMPRIFGDPKTGKINALWAGGAHGEGTQETAETNMCHDITVYPALGLAAGACSGNGLLLDIKDPAHPKRIAEVSDPNFAYWHSATFSNDGSKILYTDEWGGGVGPRCRSTDKPTWGADAIFTRTGTKMSLAGYFKLPAAQTATENCVAHNGTLIPVPGRDIMVQAWYQGGISVVDFTDPSHPVELAYFDRGPVSTEKVEIGGEWSAYWYNGAIYGSEIIRGLDVLKLVPTDQLSAHEIAAANLVQTALLNPQNQQKNVWPASAHVAHAFLDQLARNDGLAADRRDAIAQAIDAAEAQEGAARAKAYRALVPQVTKAMAGAKDKAKVGMLLGAVKQLASAK